MRDWHICVSDNIPELIDTTSSPTTVYVRRNIVPVERHDETTGETHTEYHYEEKEYAQAEYAVLCGDENGSRIADCEDALVELAEIIGGE